MIRSLTLQWAIFGVFAITLVSASRSEAETSPDAQWRAKLARTGIPELCARQWPADGQEGCVARQLDAGQKIRRMLVANQESGDFRGAVNACAAHSEAREGAYDWVEIQTCMTAWMKQQLGAEPSVRE